MATLRSLAAEFSMQPREVAALGNLFSVEDETAELSADDEQTIRQAWETALDLDKEAEINPLNGDALIAQLQAEGVSVTAMGAVADYLELALAALDSLAASNAAFRAAVLKRALQSANEYGWHREIDDILTSLGYAESELPPTHAVVEYLGISVEVRLDREGNYTPWDAAEAFSDAMRRKLNGEENPFTEITRVYKRPRGRW